MKEESSKTEKELGRDLEAFNDLPKETKELAILSDLAEKAVGSKKATLDDKIRDKSEIADSKNK